MVLLNLVFNVIVDIEALLVGYAEFMTDLDGELIIAYQIEWRNDPDMEADL